MFALDPVASSCVYPVSSGRETLMPAVWVLAAMYFWLRPTWRGKASAYVAFAGALLSKEQAVVLPLLWVLADLLSLAPDAPGRNARRWIVRYLPMLPVVAGYFAIRHALFGSSEYVLAGWAGPPLTVLYALQSVFAPFAGLQYEPPLALWISPAHRARAAGRRDADLERAPAGGVVVRMVPHYLLPTPNLLRQEAPYDSEMCSSHR